MPEYVAQEHTKQGIPFSQESEEKDFEMTDENILQCVWCLGGGKRDDRRCTACNGRGVMSLDVFTDLWASMHTNQIQQLDDIEAQVHDIQASLKEHASSKPGPMSQRNMFGGDHE